MKRLGRNSWVAPLGIAVVCLFLVPAVGLSTVLGLALLVLSGGSTIAALLFWLAFRFRAGKYDLQQLERVHERLEFRKIDEEHQVATDADTIFCIRCGNEYAAKIPVCPHCRHAP